MYANGRDTIMTSVDLLAKVEQKQRQEEQQFDRSQNKEFTTHSVQTFQMLVQCYVHRDQQRQECPKCIETISGGPPTRFSIPNPVIFSLSPSLSLYN